MDAGLQNLEGHTVIVSPVVNSPFATYALTCLQDQKPAAFHGMKRLLKPGFQEVTIAFVLAAN